MTGEAVYLCDSLTRRYKLLLETCVWKVDKVTKKLCNEGLWKKRYNFFTTVVKQRFFAKRFIPNKWKYVLKSYLVCRFVSPECCFELYQPPDVQLLHSNRLLIFCRCRYFSKQLRANRMMPKCQGIHQTAVYKRKQFLYLVRYYIHRQWQVLKDLGVPHETPTILGLGNMKTLLENPLEVIILQFSVI